MDRRTLLGRAHRLARTRFLFIPLLLSFGSAETAAAQIRDNGIGQIIARADEGAVAEFNRHDAHALAARYWDNAIDISPAGIVSGRPEIEGRFAAFFEASDPQNFIESIDKVDFSGDQGWLVGHWSDTRIAPDGARQPAKGYVAAVLEKRNATWKVRLHVITLAP